MVNTETVTIWSKDNCPYCIGAKMLCEDYGIPYTEKLITEKDGDYSKSDLLEVVPDAKTVPQVFYGDRYIGGYREFKGFLSELSSANK